MQKDFAAKSIRVHLLLACFVSQNKLLPTVFTNLPILFKQPLNLLLYSDVNYGTHRSSDHSLLH